MNEDRLMHTMLLDFYGDLLTEKQRECYDLHYNEDLTFTEIAEQSGISRQAVWDNIKRADQTLTEVEAKTGLIARFRQMNFLLQNCREAFLKIQAEPEKSREISASMLAELNNED